MASEALKKLVYRDFEEYSNQSTLFIGTGIFFYHSKIKTVSFSKAVSMNSYPFFNCTALTTANLPVMEAISPYAFSGCSALTSISIPEATAINLYSFQNCTALTTINLPKITMINSNAFSGCTALTEIHFAAANQSVIEANQDYSNKWGATNATIYFDL